MGSFLHLLQCDEEVANTRALLIHGGFAVL